MHHSACSHARGLRFRESESVGLSIPLHEAHETIPLILRGVAVRREQTEAESRRGGVVEGWHCPWKRFFVWGRGQGNTL